MKGAALIGAAAGAVALGAGVVVATDKAPYPFAQRRILDIPLPLLSRHRLDLMLRPRAGERMLEIGPGSGLQALHVAPQLGPAGSLAIVDIQQQMLDLVMTRADGRGISTISPYCAEARNLPFSAAEFDAAYLVTVLGEIPCPAQVLAEIRRVLKPSGRVVVGEFVDRHFVPVATLLRLANEVGLHLRQTAGIGLAYYAVFEPCQPD